MDEDYLKYNTKITILGNETPGHLCSSEIKSRSLQLEASNAGELPRSFERCLSRGLGFGLR